MHKSIVVFLVVGFVLTVSLPALSSCELMGLSFTEQVPVRYLFEAFRYRSEVQPSGWGLAYYPDRSVQLFKEPKPALKSPLAEFLVKFNVVKADLLVSHVRRASVGGEAYRNTHPYQREFDGVQYVLAHNGTLKNFRGVLPLERFKPIGDTDSEYLLCHIMGELASTSYRSWEQESFQWLHDTLEAANDFGSLNCLFSDGERLFVYHDKNDYTSLHYAMRVADGTINYHDSKRTVDLGSTYPATAAGVVISTLPLTDEPWGKLLPGQLLVVKKGQIIFNSEK